MTLRLVFALALCALTPEFRCREACEVLDMDYVGTERHTCVCRDPVTKDVARFNLPTC